MPSRENIRVTGTTLPEIVNSLNFALQRISDRLDQIEGVRGVSQIRSNVNLTDNSILNYLNIEEGTWTPTWQDSSFSDDEGQVYQTQKATYIKIENYVFINGHIEISDLGTLTAGSAAYIGGLPYQSELGPTAQGRLVGGISVYQGDSLNITANQTMSGTIPVETTRINMKKWDVATGTSALLISEISVDGLIIFGGQYLTE